MSLMFHSSFEQSLGKNEAGSSGSYEHGRIKLGFISILLVISPLHFFLWLCLFLRLINEMRRYNFLIFHLWLKWFSWSEAQVVLVQYTGGIIIPTEMYWFYDLPEKGKCTKLILGLLKNSQSTWKSNTKATACPVFHNMWYVHTRMTHYEGVWHVSAELEPSRALHLNASSIFTG